MGGGRIGIEYDGAKAKGGRLGTGRITSEAKKPRKPRPKISEICTFKETPKGARHDFW